MQEVKTPVDSLEMQRQKTREIFVTKDDKLDGISKSLNYVIEHELKITAVKAKIYNRYLIEGLSDEEYKTAKHTVLAELPVDKILDKESFYTENNMYSKKVVNIESVPGQYDVRVDSINQCLMLQTSRDDHKVRSFSTIAFEGNTTKDNMEKIKKWIINPVEKHEVDINETNLERKFNLPKDGHVVDGFNSWDDTQLNKYLKALDLALDIEDIKIIQTYFENKENRDPTLAELKLIETYWSDHCRHTTYNTEISNITNSATGSVGSDISDSIEKYQKKREKIGRGDKPDSLMELATIQLKYLKQTGENPNIKNVVESDEINACTFFADIELDDGTIEKREILFKNETHNHPTEIEPFGGAATCIGGCIRDPLSGRAWIFQAMRVSGAKDPTEPVSATIAGKLAQRTVSQLAALGYSSYGNQIGIHTGQVREYFHPGFQAKRFEVGFVVAGAPAKNIRREKPKDGDIVLMIGGRTGRDGVGGGAGSSKSHKATSVESLGAEVQKGNPIEERKLMRLFINPKFARLIKKCNDFGADGVAVAVGELARGLNIDLDKILVKYEGLTDIELALSESQERMAIVISKEDYDEAMRLIDEENLEAVNVATIKDNEKSPEKDRLRMSSKGKEIVNISRDFLDQSGFQRKMDIEIEQKDTDFFTMVDKQISEKLGTMNCKEAFLYNLGRLDVASQKRLGSIFDNSVGASNVLAPYGGKYQCTPQMGMVSKIPRDDGKDVKTVSIATHGYNPNLAKESSYLGAMYAVIDSVARSVALGGDPNNIWMTKQNYFGKLGKDKKRWGECYAAMLGAFRAEDELGLCALGGKDSMSGTFYDSKNNRLDVPPTVVNFGLNMGKIENIVSSEFKKPGSKVVYFPFDPSVNGIPNWDAFKKNLNTVHNTIKSKKVHSSSVIDTGGMVAAISKMCFGNNIGFEFHNNAGTEVVLEQLFYDEIGGIVLEIEDMDELPMGGILIGHTQAKESIDIDTHSIKLKEAKTVWESTFEHVFPNKKIGNRTKKIDSTYKAKQRTKLDLLPNLIETPPKVLIPVFPGTNSEIDTKNAVIRAGMQPVEFVFNNLSPEKLIESTRMFIKLLQDTQMLVLSGGFSAGDEPDGSAKFIASICRRHNVRDAMNEFFAKAGTLTLGICNGFQALVKLGVFEDGNIKDHLVKKSPILTYNNNFRHITDIVGLQTISVLSPMMNTIDVGDTFVVPVSHGEGRYLSDYKTLQQNINNGQVVFQYLDYDGNPTNNYNGSMRGVAALCSKDGKIVGMMPHPERIDNTLFQNIPGNHVLPIFKGAANAFK